MSLAALVPLLSSTFSIDVREVVSARILDGSHPEDAGRVDRYRKTNATTTSSNASVIAVVAKWSDDTTIEYLGLSSSSSSDATAAASQLTEFMVGRCDITYEDLSPTQYIEYSFADEEPVPTWHLSKTSNDGYEHFLACKFKVWEKAMKEPSCEAAFRRMLQRGLVYQMYDSNMFPTPEHLLSKYRVTDEGNGKVVELPHPVARCRVWDASAQQYQELPTTLVGAPKDEAEAKVYWATFLDELRVLRGADYIDTLLSGNEPEVPAA
jgi:hypothetical protein